MRDTTSLTKEFNKEQELVAEPRPRKKREGEPDLLAFESFKIPPRNWESLIDDYNKVNKQKFPLQPLTCKVIVEWVKRDVPPVHCFEAVGISPVRYNNLVNRTVDLEVRLEELATKGDLSEAEFNEFHSLMRNPLRILISDINRAKGIANLVNWEQFNEMSRTQPELLMAKMKAKYKDVFSEKDNGASSVNVQIQLGGDWINEI